MIGVTISGLLFTPAFYVACRSLRLWIVDVLVLRPAVEGAGRRFIVLEPALGQLRSP
jgi:hypothetical protein